MPRLPLNYLHQINNSASGKTLTIQQTHEGMKVIDGTGNILVPDQNRITIPQLNSGGNPKAYMMDNPPLCFIGKRNDPSGAFVAKFGHQSAEHQSHAALVLINFTNDLNGTSLSTPASIPNRSFPDFDMRSSAFELTPNVSLVDDTNIDPRDVDNDLYDGYVNTAGKKSLIIRPTQSSNSQYATVTIEGVISDGDNMQTEDEKNCHVILIGRNQGPVCILDRESLISGPGEDAFTFEDTGTSSSPAQGYWVAPFIIPKVVFEVGDPEPNAKIIIDDA